MDFNIGDKVRIVNNHPISHGWTGKIDDSPLVLRLEEGEVKYYKVKLDNPYNTDTLTIRGDKLEIQE